MANLLNVCLIMFVITVFTNEAVGTGRIVGPAPSAPPITTTTIATPIEDEPNIKIELKCDIVCSGDGQSFGTNLVQLKTCALSCPSMTPALTGNLSIRTDNLAANANSNAGMFNSQVGSNNFQIPFGSNNKKSEN